MSWLSDQMHMGSQLPDQGSNPHPLHWKVKSQPMDRQGSPTTDYYQMQIKTIMRNYFIPT